MKNQRLPLNKHKPQFKSRGVIFTAVLGWVWLAMLILLIDPKIVRDVIFSNSYLPLPLGVGFAIAWTMGALHRTWFKGLFWGVGTAGFVFLRTQSLGDWFSGLLIVVFLLIMEWYWRTGNDKISLNE